MAVKGLWKKEIYSGKFKFAVGFIILSMVAVSVPLMYDMIVKLTETAPIPPMFKDQVVLMKDYPSYIWAQWFGKNLFQFSVVLAIIFGAGIISSEISHKTMQFLLTKPVTRSEVFKVKYIVNFVCLALAVIVSTAVLELVVLATGHSFPLDRLILHSLLIIPGIGVIFSIAVYFSTLFDQTVKSAVLTGFVALVLWVPGYFPALQKYSVYYHMTGMSLREGNGFPFTAFAVLVLVCAGFYVLGGRRFAKRDL